MRIKELNKKIIFTFKTIIVGAQSVGKTCLFNRFCFNSFNFDTSMTIGINFHSIDLKLNYLDGNTTNEKYVVNSIFDFGGQERFKPLIPKFLGGADGALLVFDLVNRNSFSQLDFWYNQILLYANGIKIPKLLIGSKFDLVEKSSREDIVNENVINDFLKEKKIDGFFKTSALENYNVIEVFKELTNLMLKKRDSEFIVLI